MDPSTSSRESQQPFVNRRDQDQQGISVVQTLSTTTSSVFRNPLRLLPRPTTSEPNCCMAYFLKWYFYFLGIALYFYIKAGYQIFQDKKAFQENGVLGIDIAACVYPTIFIIIEAYAIIKSNKKAALIAAWGFVSYFLLYLVYALVLYYDIAKDGKERDKIFSGAEFWLAFFTGTTLSGCYCVYSELCKYHKGRVPLEERSENQSYSRA